MPISYSVDSAARMLTIVAEGELTQDDRLSAMRAWINDPAYEPGLNTLCDFSATVTSPTLPELQEIVAFIRRHAESIGRKKLAVVTARPFTFGVARQFQALADSGPLQVSVFTSRADALAWLREPVLPESR
jgi:hypothetical protein